MPGEAPSPTDQFGALVKKYRESKGWTQPELAERCRAAGLDWERHVVANVEAGRRSSVAVHEILILGRIFEIPPILLVFPVDRTATTQVMPGHVLSTWDALRWFTGEGPFAPDGHQRTFGAGEYDPESGMFGYGKYDPVTDLYEWYEQPAGAWEQGAAPLVLLRQHAHQVREWFQTDQNDKERRSAVLATIKRTRAEMRRRGQPLPEPPPGLVGIDGRSGSEQAGEKGDE